MNILGMGPMELLLIIILALIVFGPAKLPEIMGQIGKAINDFRKATSELSDEFNRTIQAELQEGRSVLDETKSVVTDVHSTVNSAVTGSPPAPIRVSGPGDVAGAPSAMATSEVYSPPPALPVAESNGTSSSNGTHGEAAKPPLADTTRWSWETAAPPPKRASEPRPNDVEPPY